MTDEIRTERLLLRRATMADTLAMNRIMSDPATMRYWSTLPHENLAQTVAWVQSMVDADRATSDDFIVTRKGAVIGKFGAWKLPEFGFLLDRHGFTETHREARNFQVGDEWCDRVYLRLAL